MVGASPISPQAVAVVDPNHKEVFKNEAINNKMVSFIQCVNITMKEEIVSFVINNTDGMEVMPVFCVGLDATNIVQVIRVNGCHRIIVVASYPHTLVCIFRHE